MENLGVNGTFWEGKRVFLTGHTGFKGAWLSLWLQEMKADVKGFALPPCTNPSLFDLAKVGEGMDSEIGDIREWNSILAAMTTFNPEILIHMAALPLVQASYKNPTETYATNVMGTVHVLEAARQCPALKAVVNVTSDKCYENRKTNGGYSESDPMGGDDPYSSSKGCAELVTSSWRQSFFNCSTDSFLASARAGNVIGGGDWSEQRLLPDILRAFEKNYPVIIRNPHATRPWQHVLEPLKGYLMLAQNLYDHGASFAKAWNFGPYDESIKPVKSVVENVAKIWGTPKDVSWELDKKNNPKEADVLALNISLAKSELGWHPLWDFQKTLENTVSWHKSWLDGKDARELCLQQILFFMGSS